MSITPPSSFMFGDPPASCAIIVSAAALDRLSLSLPPPLAQLINSQDHQSLRNRDPRLAYNVGIALYGTRAWIMLDVAGRRVGLYPFTAEESALFVRELARAGCVAELLVLAGD